MNNNKIAEKFKSCY